MGFNSGFKGLKDDTSWES